MFLLEDSEQKKQQELITVNGQRLNPGAASIGQMMNMNDEVIRKTKQYMNRFVQFKDVDVSKEMRRIARVHGISSDLCIHIQDLGLREYDEAIELFPELKNHPKEHVEELIEIIKLNTN